MELRRHPLDALFAPQTVAVIGASEKARTVGCTVMHNLIVNPFGGTVFPIHPTQSHIFGVKAYPNLAAVREYNGAPIDLAVIVTPAPTVPAHIAECAAAGVACAIITSSGFREAGAAGAALERQILKKAQRGDGDRRPGETPLSLRVLGPNSLGLMRPPTGLNATWARTMARRGGVAFISQSGALGAAVLDWSIRENFGLSAFISTGSMLDLGWGDLIDYLGTDPYTQSIVIYMETIGNARAFLSAARQVALSKPIIVLKAGRSAMGARAVLAHTGAEAGNDAVLDAALRRAGVLRVESVADLFHMAEVLAKQPRPRGPRLAILSNAGGPAVLATDALIQHGGTLAAFSHETCAALDALLPPEQSHGNPVNLGGGADPTLFAKALEIVARDPHADGILVILAPQALTDPTEIAQAIIPFARLQNKPLLASWMGGAAVESGANILRDAGIPVFPYPDQAVRMFDYMWRYDENRHALYETPAPIRVEIADASRAGVKQLLEDARATRRTVLTKAESQQILAAYGIPVIESRLAQTAAQAVEQADAMGYAECILYLASTLDPQFGPVLHFGAGAQMPSTEKPHRPCGEAPALHPSAPSLPHAVKYDDDVLGLPPLNTTLARRMMEQARIYPTLCSSRMNLAALEQILVRFSQLVVEHRWIKSIEIHPLLVLPPRAQKEEKGGEIIALDARIILHDPATREEDLPRPAIRPYPWQYVAPHTLPDGTPVLIRPIRPDDEPLLVRFHEKLSEQTVYQRYFYALHLQQRIAHERLVRVVFNDYDRELALVVEHTLPAGDERELLGVGRLSKLPATGEAEFAVVIRDDYQRHGLGTELLKRLIAIGRAEGLRRIFGEILPDNVGMQRVCEKFGFKLTYQREEGFTLAELVL